MAFPIAPLLIILITTLMSLALSNTLPASTISAAPALLPDDNVSPLSSPPALSPDITPLFPSPGGSDLSPSDSTTPLIPSSPSPPNPDAMAAPGPGMAFAPSGLVPDSSTAGLDAPVFLSLAMVLFGGILE